MLLNAHLGAVSFGQLFPKPSGHRVWTSGQTVLWELSVWSAASPSPLARHKVILGGETQTSFPRSETCVRGQRAACEKDVLSPSPWRLGTWFLHAWLQGLAGLVKSRGLIQQGLGLGGTGEQSYIALPFMCLQRASVSPFIYTVDAQPTSHRRTCSPPGNLNSKPPPRKPPTCPKSLPPTQIGLKPPSHQQSLFILPTAAFVPPITGTLSRDSAWVVSPPRPHQLRLAGWSTSCKTAAQQLFLENNHISCVYTGR